MRNLVKPIISFVAIGVFILFGMASFGPDGSTNTTVAIEDCEGMPSINVKLEITISMKWERFDGSPVTGAGGRIFVSHQKVNSNDDCTFFIESQQEIEFTTDDQGRFTYSGPTWTHDNKEDLIRVEVYGFGSALDGYTSFQEVQVNKYFSGSFYFSQIVYPIL